MNDTIDNDTNPIINIELSQKSNNVIMKVELSSVVNYALQQNRIPVIHDFLIENKSDFDLENVVVRLFSEPEMFNETKMNISIVPANSVFVVKDFASTLNASFLAGLTERLLGQLHLVLEDTDGKIITRYDCEITALAFDEWHGVIFYPELISSFVMPNHPEVAKIIARAAQLLGKWSDSPSLDAYQTQNPNRVLLQAAAVYGALQELNIVYAVPPASFERIGQRVRLCDTIIQQKLGTCLDLSLLYAACLESIGLHPILLLQKGHIFTGVWLEDLSFSEAVENDPSLITKRIADGVNEIAVVECTAFVSGKNLSFDEAVSLAISILSETNPLEYIIDVSRSRLSGIRPLPLRIQSETGWKVETELRDERELTHIPGLLSETIHVGHDVSKKAFSKMEQWERKLLDMSLRNTLINMRWTQGVIPVLCESLSELEDGLSGGAEFSIGHRPAEWKMQSDTKDIEGLTDLKIYGELIKSEFQNKRLRSLLSEGELARAIVNVYRSSRTSLEENGANTLYLALGFLRWYETPTSQKPRYAPLVLLPVEIVRKSAMKGYVIRIRDEEPQFNVTLMQMMFQDFGITIEGVDPLPLDDSGVDLRKVFTIIRQAVMGEPRWDVIQAAFLGIFSFSQFVMWNDLRNRVEDLEKNKIVRSLMNGQLAWDADNIESGEKIAEENVILPVPVDASQLYAVSAASEGKSFVLHGPPGTGKSQTITAIIANALAKGKTVLFVAEKMAALSVVHQRLKKIGIGPFCIELHSNKSNKRNILDQLNEAVQAVKKEPQAEWQKRANRTAELRKELDVYAKELHEKRNVGLSLFEMIDKYTEYSNSAEEISFTFDFVETLNEEKMITVGQILEKLVVAAKLVGHPHNHPLERVRVPLYSQQLKAEIQSKMSQYVDSLNKLSECGTKLSNNLGRMKPEKYSDWEKLSLIALNLNVWSELPRAWGEDKSWLQTSNELNYMATNFQIANELKSKLAVDWNDGLLTINAAMLKNEWEAAQLKWALPKFFTQNKILKLLKPYRKNLSAKIPKEKVLQILSDLVVYQEKVSIANPLFEKYRLSLGNLYENENTDWQKIQNCISATLESDKALEELTDGNKLRVEFAGISEMKKMYIDYIGAFELMTQAKSAFYEHMQIRECKKCVNDLCDWVNCERDMCGKISGSLDDLKDWIVWVNASNEALEAGLEPLVSSYENGISHDKVSSAFYKGLFSALINSTIEKNTVLNTFSGAIFHEKIRQFKQLDEELTELSKEEIYYRLAAQVPNFTQEASQKSEVGVLQRAIRSGGRGVSIRRLFEQISNLLPRLCPCMLMSPISAAQYLDPKRTPFDLVIFDEASQMPTARAIGALARGNNAVIVGDPKQMPPTSFFTGSAVDEDNLEAEDLESILDDTLALNLPQSYLLWHYRSRHESLIAFSNNQFYENKLFTFPSTNDRESKVTLVKANGTFERGKTRQNRAEAEAIVKEMIRRSSDEESRGKSLGVISFNIQQQNLIEDLFLEACKTNPDLERWAYESDEPIFIKNLENVQGDERDVILFSIGYGPDENGKVYMNFGPLNREGGWRRLNVAVSRARHEMMVFSSIEADKIDLSRTSAEGVAALKAFLNYAAGSSLAQTPKTVENVKDIKNGVAKEIRNKLEAAGYSTQLQVGQSEYKIDLAVVDPKNPEKYILGILLDGAVYKNSKTTRDRELSQINVLHGLGWHIHRVWSMDWWDNSEKEFAKIIELLKTPLLPPELLPKKVKSARDNSKELEETNKNSFLANEKKQIVSSLSLTKKPTMYKQAELPLNAMSADEFLRSENSMIIQKAFMKVMENEAPISESALIKRVVQSFGITRAGSRIQQKSSEIIKNLNLTYTVQNKQKFYWLNSQNPETYEGYRVSASGVRDITEIPVREIANAVVSALERQIAMPKEDLLRETANLLGFTRMGTNVSAAVCDGIKYAISKKMISEQKEDYYSI